MVATLSENLARPTKTMFTLENKLTTTIKKKAVSKKYKTVLEHQVFCTGLFYFPSVLLYNVCVSKVKIFNNNEQTEH